MARKRGGKRLRRDQDSDLKAMLTSRSPVLGALWSDRPRWVRFMVLAAAIVAAVTPYAVPKLVDLVATPASVRAQDEAEQGIDRQRPPFTATVEYPDHSTYDAGFPEFWLAVLDTPLTRAQQDELTATHDQREIWEVLRPLGARVLPFPATSASRLNSDGSTGWATEFNLRFHSDRRSTVTITDLRAKLDRCSPSKAKTVVSIPPQGESSVSGIGYDLSRGDVTPVSLSENAQRVPYFRSKQIDLGGGAGPAGLRVQSVVRAESCRWHIEAPYVDSEGEHEPIRIDDGGTPLFSEAAPAKPVMAFELIGEWTCDGDVTAEGCERQDGAVWRNLAFPRP